MISEMFDSLAQIRGLLNTLLLEGAPLDVHENIYLTTVAAMLHHGAMAPGLQEVDVTADISKGQSARCAVLGDCKEDIGFLLVFKCLVL